MLAVTFLVLVERKTGEIEEKKKESWERSSGRTSGRDQRAIKAFDCLIWYTSSSFQVLFSLIILCICEYQDRDSLFFFFWLGSNYFGILLLICIWLSWKFWRSLHLIPSLYHFYYSLFIIAFEILDLRLFLYFSL